YLGTSWLLTPRAKTIETTPFSGRYWHNPYQNLNLQNVWNANFHAHSNNWGMFTNGSNNSPEKLYDAYKRMGFDIAQISDYQNINPFRDTAPDYIPAYEHGYSFKKTHQLSLGAKCVTGFDVMLPQPTGVKQFFINKLKSRCDVLCLTHPKAWGGYTDVDLLKLTGYDLFEVLNYDDDLQEPAWDLVLSNGNLVYILASDDTHDILRWIEIGRRFVRVFADNTNAQNVLTALKNGHHYGVNMPVLDGETFEQKAERIKQLPNVTRFEIVDDSLHIAIDEPQKTVEIIGDYGFNLYRHSGAGEVVFDLNNLNPFDITYVRVKIFLPNGIVYYFNPITRTATYERR
ncbi:MAG: hypothetical protein LBU91_05815, partial [Bacteroidales bacterium]|nr:hypothetical protein [Bacteroidales bacterium]